MKGAAQARARKSSFTRHDASVHDRHARLSLRYVIGRVKLTAYEEAIVQMIMVLFSRVLV